jgi:hypothetical protein
MKKVISVLFALFMLSSVFLLPVYADDDTAFTDGVENAVRAAAIIEKYKQYQSGTCTEEEFKTYVAEKTGQAYYDGIVDRTFLVQALTQCGVDVAGYINAYFNDGQYEDDFNADNLKGYGCCVRGEKYFSDSNLVIVEYIYGDYGVISSNICYTVYNCHKIVVTRSDNKPDQINNYNLLIVHGLLS